jgi:hypothetical protein
MILPYIRSMQAGRDAFPGLTQGLTIPLETYAPSLNGEVDISHLMAYENSLEREISVGNTGISPDFMVVQLPIRHDMTQLDSTSK